MCSLWVDRAGLGLGQGGDVPRIYTRSLDPAEIEAGVLAFLDGEP